MDVTHEERAKFQVIKIPPPQEIWEYVRKLEADNDALRAAAAQARCEALSDAAKVLIGMKHYDGKWIIADEAVAALRARAKESQP